MLNGDLEAQKLEDSSEFFGDDLIGGCKMWDLNGFLNDGFLVYRH